MGNRKKTVFKWVSTVNRRSADKIEQWMVSQSGVDRRWALKAILYAASQALVNDLKAIYFLSW